MTTDRSPIPGAVNLPKLVWPCVVYRDASAAIRFLQEAFGFVAAIVVDDPAHPEVVHHCQMIWPEGGGVMLGSAGRDESPFAQQPIGGSSVYVVTDDPYGVQQRAIAAGATPVREMADEDYGSTGFAVADPEGNLWSFGTYRGEGVPDTDATP